MFIAHKYRIYPTKNQEEKLINWLGQIRFIWNYFLSQNNVKYEYERKFNFVFDMANQLPELKKQYDWIDIPSGAAQDICFNLDRAINDCIKKICGYPKFKSKRNPNTGISIPQVGNHIRLHPNNKIQIPKLGLVKIELHRSISKIKNTTITRTKSNQWYVSLLTEVNELPLTQINKSIGIDLGLTSFLTTSDNTKITNPRFNKKHKRKLKLLQRAHAKTKKGSKNREKRRLKIARLYQKITNQRNDYLHKTSRKIIENNDLVCCESLKIKNLMKNKFMSYSIADVSWALFVNMLSYKSKLHGKHFVQIDQFMPSTKTCSSCNHKQSMTLKDRIFNCTNCNLSIDRDFNASINIHNWGKSQYTAGTAGMYACGDTSIYQTNTDRCIYEAGSLWIL